MNKLSVVSARLSEQHGFTYLGLLFAVAMMGATLALTGVVWHTVQKREKEKELLFIGQQFRQAIAAYYNRSPGGTKQFPKELQELVKDPRHLTTERYLRRLYADPLTGSKEWGLVKTRDDRIAGVYSLSEDEPLKQGNFREAEKEFEGKTHYSEWRFVYSPPQPTPQSAPQQAAPVLNASQPPPAALLPAPPVQEAKRESLCDTLLRNDIALCQVAAARFGEEAVQACADSAQVRFAACQEKQSSVDLPPLKATPDTPPDGQ